MNARAALLAGSVVAGLMLAAVPAGAETAVPARRALGESVRELSADNVALGKVIEFLRQSSGANIYVNWKVLEGVNVTKDTLVSIQVSNLSLAKMLHLVLDQAGGNANLVFTVDENVIQITTQEEADKQLITRVYVVDDLVMPSNKNAIQPVQMGLGTSQTVSSGSGGGVGGGMGIFGNGGGGQGQGVATDQTADMEKAGQDLVKLVMEIVRPNVWKDNGGNSTIRYFQGKLIVTAPISVQEAIGGPVNTGRFGF